MTVNLLLILTYFDSGMTRRSNKRYRNKSSPQTTSSSKKQRNHTPDKQPGLAEQTESDISDLSNLSNPRSDIVTPTPTSFADMAAADHHPLPPNPLFLVVRAIGQAVIQEERQL